MRFLVNAPRWKARKARKKKASTATRRRRQLVARGRRLLSKVRASGGAATMARKRRKKGTARRRASARRKYATNAPRRRGVRRYASNPPRRARRRRGGFRRNPPILATVKRGVVDALGVTGGKAVYNLARKNLPFQLPLPGVAGELATGLLVAGLGAFAVGMTGFVRGDLGRMVTAGLFQGVVESGLRALNVPMVTAALGSYDNYAGMNPGLFGYPRTQPVLPAGQGLAAYDTEADEIAMSEQQW